MPGKLPLSLAASLALLLGTAFLTDSAAEAAEDYDDEVAVLLGGDGDDARIEQVSADKKKGKKKKGKKGNKKKRKGKGKKKKTPAEEVVLVSAEVTSWHATIIAMDDAYVVSRNPHANRRIPGLNAVRRTA